MTERISTQKLISLLNKSAHSPWVVGRKDAQRSPTVVNQESNRTIGSFHKGSYKGSPEPETSQANAELASLSVDLAKEIIELRRKIGRYELALTPSQETKRTYIGEFSFSFPIGYDEDGNDVIATPNVPWDTVKDIMSAIKKYAKEIKNE